MTGLILTIAQQKGGSGKTTLAAHLAVAATLRGLSVALLDCDPQGSLGEWFEARERRLGEDAAGMAFRTASGWGARREARGLARDHDVVVIDTPPKSDLECRPAIETASLVVIPVQPTPVDLWATQATLDSAAKAGVPALMVINRAQPRTTLTARMREAIAGLGPIASTELASRVAFAASMETGASVLETGRSAGADEMAALAAEVLKAAGG